MSPWLAAALTAVVFTQGAYAAVPKLEHYSRTTWSTKEGLPGAIRAMAQTADGWLWLGTTNGLFRFDGLRFHPVATANGERLLNTQISVLTAGSNGALYIGYEDFGLSVLHPDGRLQHLAPADKGSPVAQTYAILRDIDGTLWVGTSSGLLHLENDRWKQMGEAQGFPGGRIFTLVHDIGGRLWTASETQLFQYDRERRRFTELTLPSRPRGGEQQRYFNLVMSRDGKLWDLYGGRLTLIPTLPAAGARPYRAATRMSSWEGLFDSQGQIWAMHCPVGICLAPARLANNAARVDISTAATSRFNQPWQIASLAPEVMLEDQEGNVWVGSRSSLERFRRNPMTAVELPPTNGTYHVAPDSDGSVWVVAPNSRKGWRYDPVEGRFTALPGVYRSAHRSADGTMVLLKEDGIRRRRGGVEDAIALPDLPPRAWIRGDGQLVWLGGAGTPARMWDGREWHTLTDPKPEEFTFSAAGRHGQMWRALVDGRLLLFENGKIVRDFFQVALGGIGIPTGLSAEPELVVCGESGIAVWDGQRFRRLQAARPELLRKVSGIVATADGTRWLNGSAGLLRVAPADWRRSIATGVPLRATLLDALDGLPGPAAAAPSLTLVGERLWVATHGGMVEIDPARRSRNEVAPRVAFLGLSGDGMPYTLATPEIRAHTTRLRIDFTAPSLRKPERVLFSYRLDGVDKVWQTGAERSASYTGLAPGEYLFRVRAMNEDGVWSEREQTLAFKVAPTMVQTVYFKLACALAAVMLLWLAHRLRLRYLTRNLSKRHHIQLEERTRIARELHDSLLQDFQGAVLEMKTALSGLGLESPLYKRLKAGVHDANAAIAEGREKVEALRDAGTSRPSLHDYLLQVGEREAGPDRDFALRVEGPARPLQPVVEQELCAIGREALRNAFQHAGASRHEVLVEYGARSLALTVSDNGRGIDAEARDKPGHWGLRGIEERARLIHADALLHTTPGGTRWRIEVSSKLAYVDGRRRKRWWTR